MLFFVLVLWGFFCLVFGFVWGWVFLCFGFWSVGWLVDFFHINFYSKSLEEEQNTAIWGRGTETLSYISCQV